MIDIIFSGINLLLMALLGGYFIVHFIIPMLVKLRLHRNAFFSSLYREKKSLEEKQHLVNQECCAQHEFIENVTHTIAVWRTSFKERHLLEKEKAKKAQERLQLIHEQRDRSLVKSEQEQIDVPLVIARTRELLVKEFSSSQQGEEYIHRIVSRVSKE